MRQGCALLILLGAAPVGVGQAAEVADVIDADDGADVFDLVGEIGYRRLLRRAKITREYGCDPHRATNPRRFWGDTRICGDAGPAGRLITAKEARYTRVTHELIPRVRIGLWHDLELAITAPIVISDSQELRFAGNGGDVNGTVVNPDNSQIAPAEGAQLFPLPTDGLPTRAGFGDMTFMLRWAPVSRERDPSQGEWAVELGYQVPTGEVMRFGNEGVGRGTHRLLIGSAFSYRLPHVDPYARVGVELPFAAEDSLFKDYGDAQEFVGPGPRVDFDLGAEFVPIDDPAQGLKVFIDVGLGASYQAAGRDYTALFDALALGARRCTPDPTPGPGNCGRYNPGSRSAIADTPHDGITTVQEHVQVRGRLGVGAHIAEHARIALNLSLAHDTEHFISDAAIGKDLDGSGRVEDPTNAGYDPVEHNPTFVPAIDSVGRRLRVEATTIFGVGLTVGAAF